MSTKTVEVRRRFVLVLMDFQLSQKSKLHFANQMDQEASLAPFCFLRSELLVHSSVNSTILNNEQYFNAAVHFLTSYFGEKFFKSY